MRTKTLGLAITALVAAVAFGQGPELTRSGNKAAYEGKGLEAGSEAVRVFYLTHGETPQDAQEIINLIRTMAEIQRMFPYSSRGAIAVRGNPGQIALAEWLFSQLDKPVNPQTAKTAANQFPGPGGADEVRVFYLTHGETQADTQGMVNLIRTTTEIQRMYPYAARSAIALRGTPDQIALAEWLFAELDKTASPSANRTAAYESAAPSGRGDAVRLFFCTHGETPQDLRQITQLIGVAADIQRIISYGPRRAIALRGSPAQIALAEWLFAELSAPASEQVRAR